MVPKIWKQIFGPAFSSPKYLNSNHWDHCKQFQKFECKSLGLLSVVPKIWMQIFELLSAVPKIWLQIFGTAISGPKELNENCLDYYNLFWKLKYKSLGLLLVVLKISMQIFGTVISSHEDLDAILWYCYLKSQRYACTFFGLLSSIPKIENKDLGIFFRTLFSSAENLDANLQNHYHTPPT